MMAAALAMNVRAAKTLSQSKRSFLGRLKSRFASTLTLVMFFFGNGFPPGPVSIFVEVSGLTFSVVRMLRKVKAKRKKMSRAMG